MKNTKTSKSIAILLVMILFMVSGCSGSKGGKDLKASEKVVKELVKVQVPDDLKETDDLGSWAVKKEGEGWRFIVDVVDIKMIGGDNNWSNATKILQEFYKATDYKLNGKDAMLYDAGSALAITSKTNDTKAITIRIKANVDDKSGETPKARKKLLDNVYIKFMLKKLIFNKSNIYL